MAGACCHKSESEEVAIVHSSIVNRHFHHIAEVIVLIIRCPSHSWRAKKASTLCQKSSRLPAWIPQGCILLTLLLHCNAFDYKDPIARIAAIIQSRKRKKKQTNVCLKQMHRVKELFKFSLVTRRLLGIPLLFLFFYYIVQILYQLDIYPLCGGKNTSAESCRSWTKKVLTDNASHYPVITKLITFLLGFYVSNIINRWWNKIRSIPKAENPSLVLAALTWELPNAKTEELTSPTAVAEAKKMFARYCLLSWAMCFSTFSKSLASTCGTARQMEERGLITKDEIAALQVSFKNVNKCKNQF